MRVLLTATASGKPYDGLSVTNSGSVTHDIPSSETQYKIISESYKLARDLAPMVLEGKYPKGSLEPLRHAVNKLHDASLGSWSEVGPKLATDVASELKAVLSSMRKVPTSAGRDLLSKLAHDKHELLTFTPLKAVMFSRAWMNACYSTIYQLLKYAQLVATAKDAYGLTALIEMAERLTNYPCQHKSFSTAAKDAKAYAVSLMPKAKFSVDAPTPTRDSVLKFMRDHGITVTKDPYSFDGSNSMTNYDKVGKAPAGKVRVIHIGEKQFDGIAYFLVGDKVYATAPAGKVVPLTDIQGRPFKAPAAFLGKLASIKGGHSRRPYYTDIEV